MVSLLQSGFNSQIQIFKNHWIMQACNSSFPLIIDCNNNSHQWYSMGNYHPHLENTLQESAHKKLYFYNSTETQNWQELLA